MNYYNDNEKYVAQWLRNLIAASHIGAGTVDERSIHDVRPEDLAEFTRCHFFAGIAGWEFALNLAGWPTPQTHDERKRGNTEADHHHFPHDLSNAAETAGWATPNWHDGRRPGADLKSTQGGNLNRDVHLAGWGTPRSPESGHSVGNPDRSTDGRARLEDQVHGTTPNGSHAQTASGGVLNAEFVRWLMGYPAAWERSRPMATQLSRKSRQSS
jgi:hypothetical protein